MTARKYKIRNTPMVGGKPHHFYATSIARWKVSDNIGALIDAFRKDGYDFSIWYVPLPLDASYKIEEYRPKVDGLVWLGTYEHD